MTSNRIPITILPIEMPPYIRMFGLCLYFYIQLVAFLVRANQHVNNQCDCKNCNNQTEYIYITSEQLAQLVHIFLRLG